MSRLSKQIIDDFVVDCENDEQILECAKLGTESMKILHDVKPIITSIWMNMSDNPDMNPQIPIIESLLMRIDENLSSWISE